MRSRKVRFTSLFVVLAAALAITGLIAPGASAAYGDLHVEFVEGHQPADAIKNQLITAVPFDPSPSDGETAGPFVQVHVTKDFGEGVGNLAGAQVTFRLATSEDGSLATGTLTVTTETTDFYGIATFDSSLSIAEPNEPQFTDYRLVPVATEPPPSDILSIASETTGAPSNGFDIFEKGCQGSGCSVAIRGGLDVYTTTQNVRLTASVLSASTLPGLRCRNQRLIFPSDVFVHETNGMGVVGLVSHVTFSDLTGGGGGGAAVATVPDDDDGVRIKWCVGTRTRLPWLRNGAPFVRQDTNGDGRLDLYVGSAPRCPRNNPRSFAPCIVSRVRDGHGGFFIRGWLPGGDPPRRT